MKTLTIIAFLFAGVVLASGGAYDYLCDENDFFNGVSHYNHPNDCSKYVQCSKNALGELGSKVRHCGFGTYWSMGDMTCLSAPLVVCKKEFCLASEAAGRHRAAHGNCRGYWQCVGKMSIAMCCPSGQHYNSSTLCENNFDGECTDDCLGKYVAPVVNTNDTGIENSTDATQDFTTTEATISCGKHEIAGEPSRYNWKVNGRSHKMHCPSGTVFVQNKCMCLGSENAALTCTPELLLKFTNGLKDESRNNLEVKNVSVMVENGEAIFDGITSQLVIPFFTNLDVKDTLIIRMKYTSDHMDIAEGEQRALFSNFDCNIEPSVQMSETSQYLTALVGASKPFETSVLQTPVLAANDTVSEKNVVYKFQNDQLSLSVGPAVTGVATTGKLRKIQCALHIGSASGMKNFKGRIDEFAVYQCDPKA